MPFKFLYFLTEFRTNSMYVLLHEDAAENQVTSLLSWTQW